MCREDLSELRLDRIARMKALVQRLTFVMPRRFAFDNVSLRPLLCLAVADPDTEVGTPGFLILRVAGLLQPPTQVFLACKVQEGSGGFPPDIGSRVLPVCQDADGRAALWSDVDLKMKMAHAGNIFQVFPIDYRFLETGLLEVMGAEDITGNLPRGRAAKVKTSLGRAVQHVLNFKVPLRKRKAGETKGMRKTKKEKNV